jgi:Domain of unknown function (DUF4410)
MSHNKEESLIGGKSSAMKRASQLAEFALLVSVTALGQQIQPATDSAKDVRRQSHPAPSVAVLYRFANVSDVAMLSEGPVKETCRRARNLSAMASASGSEGLTAEEEFKAADRVIEVLAKGLDKKIPVAYENPPRMPAVGSLVFTGCFVDMEAGSASKRVVGMGLGASRLSAHVRVFYADASGPMPAAEFDVVVTGTQKIPALGAVGLAFNAGRASNDRLEGDATRLAEEILTRLKQDNLF